MPTYRLDFSPVARKQLKKLTPAVSDRLMDRIVKLGENPRAPGCLKMEGDSSWRIRVGSYRVIYDIFDERLVVLVLRVGDRKNVYLVH